MCISGGVPRRGVGGEEGARRLAPPRLAWGRVSGLPGCTVRDFTG